MSNRLKVTLYFINSLFLYSILGILCCNISFPILGMIIGSPSVFVGAVALALARTVEVYMQGSCEIDLKDYLRGFIYLIIIIAVIVVLVASLMAVYRVF